MVRPAARAIVSALLAVLASWALASWADGGRLPGRLPGRTDASSMAVAVASTSPTVSTVVAVADTDSVATPPPAETVAPGDAAPADDAPRDTTTAAPADGVDPDTTTAPVRRPRTWDTRRRDPLQPSLPIESLADKLADTTQTLDTTQVSDSSGVRSARVERYLGRRPGRRGLEFGRTSPLLGPRAYRPAAELDSTSEAYITWPEADPSSAFRLDPGTYRSERFLSDRQSSFRRIAEQQRGQRRSRGGLGVNIVVPGGRQSPFSTIFGKPQVDLRVNGVADINAGFDYRKSDRQVSITGNASQLDPSFKQDLTLGITGTVGDKMQIDIDWDTNNQFDYQNQVKLKYTGYEDEIIQSIEAGNVFLETPSQLITGGTSQFGIKSRFQVGNFGLTAIASQQEGQSNQETIKGGSEASEFEVRPSEYDDNTHFFLGYFFRNSWNEALSDPNSIQLQRSFQEITEIEVWRRVSTNSESPADARSAVAIVDLGENPVLITQTQNYRDLALPREDGGDQYPDPDLEVLRANESGAGEARTYLQSDARVQPLDNRDFDTGKFVPLQRNRDYTINETLGYISLSQRLQENEALAVSYKYRTSSGEVFSVGDFSTEDGGTEGGQGERQLILKLLRPGNMPAPTASEPVPAWYLQMRNIYRLGGRGFTPDNFDLDIAYSPPGQSGTQTLQQIDNQPLLRVLGLDRLNINGAQTPDNQFDFIPGITIKPGDGLLVFPYLEPFGERLRSVAEANGTLGQAEDFIFEELYDNKRETVVTNDRSKDSFLIRGEYRGSAQEFFDLGAFTGIVDGSVSVTSGGTELQEGTDYVVDYQGGTVTITDRSYLAEGRDIQIDYEQNSISNLQQKTLLGARADYELRDRVALGATLMRLSERSPVDKYRIGEEPIRNTIWGVDGSVNLEPGWLTRAVDALPLIQTRGESSIQLSGEFAQLRPGHNDTEAYQRTQDRLSSAGQSFRTDERAGISSVDDFEGFENTFSLAQNEQAWSLSAPPAENVSGLGAGGERDSLVSNRRATFGWYQLNQNTLEDVRGKSASRGNEEGFTLVNVRNVFPNRDLSNDIDPTIRTLDLHFNPFERGPYNYTTELGEFVRTPEENWGGFTQRLPDGYKDFSLQNVEFVEFIFRPVPEDESQDVGPDATLYLNLGTISEDIIPNGRRNSEDGLSNSFRPEDLDAWGRTPSAQTNQAIDVSSSRTEDLGLDGLVSYDPSSYEDELLESTQFASFLQSLDTVDRSGLTPTQQQYLDAEIARARLDPSGDDYQYFDNDVYFQNRDLYPEGATVQQRFSRYNTGGELDGFESQNRLARNVSVRRGVSQEPDDEDLNFNQTIDTVNEYYEYEIPLSETRLRQQADETATNDFVVSEIQNSAGQGTGWYKVRVPVGLADDYMGSRDDVREVGNIDGFNLIESIRMWTSGHSQPMTIRFATLELVGSQWREAPDIAEENLGSDDTTSVVEGNAELRVASVNNEEDANYASPLGAILSQTRSARGTQAQSREQSLVLSIDDLGSQPAGRIQQRAVVKTYQLLNLLKYRRLRMYTHLHGTISSGGARSIDGPNNDILDENVRLFVRFGSNETNDYYEYEQRLVADDIPAFQPDLSSEQRALQLWREENAVDLVISALNRLKVARDQAGTNPSEVFSQPADALSDAYVGREIVPTLKIRGTPALSGVTTVVIGVRHVGESTSVIENTELWVNELRVTGYDERPGWAVTSNASVKLADVAEISGSFENETDGFGGLSSTLDQRQQEDVRSWNLRSEFSADKLLPERQGWEIPVSLQASQSRTTPRFDPIRSDVRVDEIVQQIEQDDALTADQKDRQIQEVRERAETLTLTQSMTVGIRKQGSESWVLRNTVDALSLDGSYSTTDARSPTQLVSDRWNWTSDATYDLRFGQPRTVAPLGFLDDIPVLGALGTLQFNYVPQSLRFTASADRAFSTQRNRDQRIRPADDAVLGRAQNPFRDTQTFNHSRNFDFQYSPFEFLNLSFGTQTNQTLNRAGADEIINLYDRDGRLVATTNDLDRFLEDSDEYDESSLNDSLFVENRLNLKSESEVLGDLLGGEVSPRTSSYSQRFTGTLRPSLLDGEAFNWISLRDITYSANFNWQNAAEGSPVGATVSNTTSLSTGLSLQPNRVWERFGFFRAMKEAQQNVQQEKQAERNRRERERQERRDAEAQAQDRDDAEDAPDADNPNEASGDEESEEETPDADTAAEDADENAAEAAAETGDGEPAQRSWSDLPLPDPVGILRRVALTFLDIQDMRFTYTADRQARSTGVGRESEILPPGSDEEAPIPTVNYSIYDALSGKGPSLGYRFGLGRSIGVGQRVLGTDLRVEDVLSNTNTLGASTTLSPSQSLQVDLNWNVSWNNAPKTTYSRFNPEANPDANPVNVQSRDDGLSYTSFETEAGGGSASVWTFGSFETFFERQRDRLQDNIENGTDGSDPATVARTNTSATNDFREAYLIGGATIGAKGFVPFPMPSWTVRYSGISSWPLLKRIAQSATLRHAYTGSYETSYASVSTAGDTTAINLTGIGNALSFRQPEFASSQALVRETFRPFIGLDISWLGGFQTTIDWNRENRASLSTTNLSVAETKASELSLSATYRKQGLKLPLLSSRLNNQITFSLTVKRAVADERTFSLPRALSEAAAANFQYSASDATSGDNVSITEQTTLLTIEPQLQYQFSQRVKGQFQVTYERLDGDSRQPSYTNIAGTFNVRINISEN